MSVIQNFFANITGEQVIELIIAIIIIVAFDLFSPVFSYIVIKLFNFKKKGDEIRQNAFYLPLKFFFKALGVYLAILYLKPVLNLTDNFMNIVTKLFKIVVIINTAIALAKSLDKDSFLVRKIVDKSDKELENPSIKIIIRVIKFIIYIIAAFMVMSEFGYDLGGLVTGLGLGSVVLTLAAQDTLKNLFSGVMIAVDKPFQVGDYVQFGTYEGTIEDITFRSTRVRTKKNYLAQVPNSVISNSTVVNISKIKRRYYEMNFTVDMDTDLEKLLNFQKTVSKFLSTCPLVAKNTSNVYFKEVSSDNYTICAYCYLNVANYDKYCREKGRLNYEMMNIVKQCGINLAYSTITVKN